MGYQGLDFGGVADRLTNTLAQGYKDRNDLENERQNALNHRQLQQAQFAQAQAQQARMIEHEDQRENIRDARARAIAELHYGAAGRGPSGAAGVSDAKTNKRLTEFNKAVNPDLAPRGSPLGNARLREQRARGVEALFEAYPDLNNMPPQQVYEIAKSFDSLVSGGSGSISGTEHLVPKSALGDFASFQNYLSNRPGGANLGQFLHGIKDSVEREKNVAREQTTRAIKQAEISYRDLKQTHPDQYNEILQLSGLVKAPIPQDIAHPGVRANIQKVLDAHPDLTPDQVQAVYSNARNVQQKLSVQAQRAPQSVPAQAPMPPQMGMPQAQQPQSFRPLPQNPYQGQSPYQSSTPTGAAPQFQGLSQTAYAAQAPWSPEQDDPDLIGGM